MSTKIGPVTVIKAACRVAEASLGLSVYPGVLSVIVVPVKMLPDVSSANLGKALRGSVGLGGGQETMNDDARVYTSFGSSGESNGEGNGRSFKEARI